MAVFINEFHYDNEGTDTGEFIEIAGTAGTDLSAYSISRFNGTNPAAAIAYASPGTLTLTGIIPDQDNGYGTLRFVLPTDGLQNGGNDGFALIGPGNTVLELLSYEGVFTVAAGQGPASGMTSTDVGRSESSATLVGASIGRVGTGTQASDFTWANDTTGTPNAVNSDQSFGGTPPPVAVSLLDVAIAEGDAGTTNFVFTVTRSSNTGSFTVDFATTPVDANPATDYTPTSGTLTFTAGGPASQTITVQVAGDTEIEPTEAFTVNLSNLVNTAGTAAITDAQGIGSILNDDVTITRIHDIQGATHSSALAGQTLTTTGIVTAVASNGFYLQEKDALVDADVATSEAIFVFTGTAPSISIGHELNVTGRVTEFIPGGATTGNLSTTEIDQVSSLVTISTGNTLPSAIVLGAGGRQAPTEIIDNDNFSIFDPTQDGLDFYESVEAMLVTIPTPLVVGATNSFGEIWTVADNGANATNLNSRGVVVTEGSVGDGLLVTNAGPGSDYNPERIQIDAASPTTPGSTPSVNVGTVLNDVTGVVSYNFGNFEVIPTTAITVATNSTLQAETTTLAGDADTLTIGSYNVLNLDPSDGATRFAAIAAQIVGNLQAPDVIALQEIQDNNGATNDGVTAANVTLQMLVDAIAAAGGPTYSFIDNPFVTDDQVGGEPGGNIRVAYLYNDARVDLKPGSVTTTTDSAVDFAGSRQPLVATFVFNEEEVTLINNHFSSKGGSTPLFGAAQPSLNGSAEQRLEQAQNVADYVAGLDPAAKVIVLGDLNEFTNEESLAPLTGVGLSAMSLTLAPSERYSYNFEGNAQELDQAYVSANVAVVAEMDIVHANTEFAYSANGGSDHDPSVLALSLPEPDYEVIGGVKVYGAADGALHGSTTTPTASNDVVLVRLGSIQGASAGAESVAYANGKVYATNLNGNTINIHTVTAGGTLVNEAPIALAGLPDYKTAGGGGVNGVAVSNGIIAVGYENATVGQPGRVALFNAADNSLITTIQVGVLPDQLTFTPDGLRLLVANEAEAVSAANNANGSISVIDLSGGAAAASVISTIDFALLNGSEAVLKAQGLALFPGFAAAADIEPEYITVSPDGSRAYVTLQEVNAVAVIDLTTATGSLVAIQPLGTVDWSLPGNTADFSDRDGAGATASIDRVNADVLGVLQPDAIASFAVGGVTYFVTANEGDSRVGSGIADSTRLSSASYVLDATAYPNAAALKADAELGRLNVLTHVGDTDGDGDIDQIHTLGGRGITIFRQEVDGSITKVRETGGEFEAITAQLAPGAFNSNQSIATSSFDTRSDDKGPEPEGVTIGQIGDSIYAFVGLERVGGYMVYDVTDPENAQFVSYKPQTGADLGPETSVFVAAANSPTGEALLVSGQEISNTVTLYSVQRQSEGADTIVGGSDAEVWTGRGGNDTIRGNGGNDTIDGGADFDTARFSGNRAGYQVTNQGLTVTDIDLSDGNDGTDTLSNVEQLQFADGTFATESFATYTLQLLHLADGEAGLLAGDTAKYLAAMVDAFEDDYANSITLAGGDTYLPGPFLAAGTDPALIPVINATTGSTISTAPGSTAAPGVVDTAIHNLIGVQASGIGNHEWDLGSNVYSATLAPGGGWVGAQYASISANLVLSPPGFPSDPLAGRFTQTVGTGSLANEEASDLKGRIAPSAVINEGGETIGLVGVTTQILESISSPSGAEILGFPYGAGPNGEVNDMALLAAQLQPVIDDLRAQGVDKIILLSHLQQINYEMELAPLLKGVDIILAAGSNTRLGDADDQAVNFPGHSADFADTYPLVMTDADGKTTLIVNTDNEYTYLGRLVVDFDANGDIILDSLAQNVPINGAYASTAENAAEAWGVAVADLETTAFAEGTRGDKVRDLTEAVDNVIAVKDGNIYGYSEVYLEGERVQVRNQETNLGNVSADANADAARDALGLTNEAAVVSIKNGGGIRAQIGTIVNNPDGTVTKVAPEVGGEVSQLDVENALRFDNKLMVFDTTAQGLLNILNSPNALAPNNGGFVQIGGVQFSYDPTRPAGSRVRDVALIDAEGNKVAAIANDGVVLPGAPALIQVVALNFTANGGDGYLIKANADNFRYLKADGTLSGPVPENLDFTATTTIDTYAGSSANLLGEQQAFAEYFQERHATPETAYDVTDTGQAFDLRIQNQAARTDTVLEGETYTGTAKANTLTGTDFNDQLLGLAGTDTLNGGGGDDVLNGGLARDVMIGGTGNDTYYVDNVFDMVTENAAEGVDTIISSIQLTVAANVENATLTGANNIRLSGNDLDNVLTGNAGNNKLEGFGGNDSIVGGAGNDTILGGLGIDILTGGADADRFQFGSIAETGLGGLRDTITDFSAGIDRIALNLIDANANKANNQAFAFIGDSAFSNVAGQLRAFADGANTVVAGDTNGDGIADFEILLLGTQPLTSADFVL